MIDVFRLGLVGLLLAEQLKLVLRWTYYWQLKEYRWDAMQVEMSSPVWKNRLAPTRHLYRPVWTAKAKLVTILSLVLGWILLWGALSVGPMWLGLVAVLLSPVVVGVAIVLLLPLDILVKKKTIQKARTKLEKQKELVMIGITGSYGKTSTKEILAVLLREKYRVLATPKNYNTELGVAEAINSSLESKHEVFIVEMGAYKKGEIKVICDLVKPSVGILTGLSNQHMALFGSQQNLFDAKSELAESLPSDGLMVINADIEAEWQMKDRTIAKVVDFSDLTDQQFDILNQLNIPDSNARAAVAVAKYLKLSDRQIQAGFKKLLTTNRLSRKYDFVKTAKGYTVIYDDYNSNLPGFSYALKILKKQEGKRKIVISSGVRELGNTAEEVHQELAHQMVGWVKELIVTQPGYLQLFTMKGLMTRYLTSVGMRKWLAKGGVQKGDVVLVEGKQKDGFRKMFK